MSSMSSARVLGLVALAVFAASAATAAPPGPAAARAPVAAPVGVLKPWIVDAKTSTLGFSATQTGKAFKGAFQKFSPVILFDPANLAASSIKVTVDMASARTGDGQRDAALPTPDWFDAKKFPQAKFVSTKIVAKGQGAYEAVGTLTIRDVSLPLTLPFALTITGDKAAAKGAVTLQRQKFGVGKGDFATDEWVGFDVAVSYVINAVRAK